DLRDAAARERHAAVAGTRLDADLRDAGHAGSALGQLAAVPVEIGPQVVGRRVLLADLADLASHDDRDVGWFVLPDERGQLRLTSVVLPLLLVDRGLAEVDEGGAVDVDVAIARRDRVHARLADLAGHLLRILGVLAGVELVMVALNEHGA